MGAALSSEDPAAEQYELQVKHLLREFSTPDLPPLSNGEYLCDNLGCHALPLLRTNAHVLCLPFELQSPANIAINIIINNQQHHHHQPTFLRSIIIGA